MPTSNTLSGSVFDLVMNAGPMAKVVLAVLAVFSIVSWALIIEKWRLFRRVRVQTLEFLRAFREARRPTAVYQAAKKATDSPLAHLYAVAYHEAFGVPDIDGELEEVEEAGPARLEAMQRSLRRAAALEIPKLERYLPFLATTASVTPFIGLFGTVWGVMAAFHGIGQQGSASLAVVAPGISEALIATAAGLGAAIPAVIGYNLYLNRVKHWAAEMEGFTLDLLNLFTRALPKLARPAKDGI